MKKPTYYITLEDKSGKEASNEQYRQAYQILESLAIGDPYAELLPEGWSRPAQPAPGFEAMRRNQLLKEWGQIIESLVPNAKVVRIEQRLLP